MGLVIWQTSEPPEPDFVNSPNTTESARAFPEILTCDMIAGHMSRGTRVKFGNLNWQTTESDLEEEISKYVEVEKVEVPRYPNGRARGHGFVNFFTPEDAERVYKLLNETMLFGRRAYLTFEGRHLDSSEDRRGDSRRDSRDRGGRDRSDRGRSRSPPRRHQSSDYSDSSYSDSDSEPRRRSSDRSRRSKHSDRHRSRESRRDDRRDRSPPRKSRRARSPSDYSSD
jgi:RNA recognition motif-containing protein